MQVREKIPKMEVPTGNPTILKNLRVIARTIASKNKIAADDRVTYGYVYIFSIY